MCSSESRGIDWAKHDEVYYTMYTCIYIYIFIIIIISVLWISITSSPKPNPTLRPLHSNLPDPPCNSFTPVKNLGKNCKMIGIDLDWYSWWTIHPAKQLNPLENFNKTVWCWWHYFLKINCLELAHFSTSHRFFPCTFREIKWDPQDSIKTRHPSSVSRSQKFITSSITPSSRLSHKAIGFLGFTGLEVWKIRSNLSFGLKKWQNINTPCNNLSR